MTGLTTPQLIAAIGIIIQLMVDGLLVGLFVLLRKYADGRTWFRAWTFAWGFLALALACVTWSYFGPIPAGWNPTATYALQFVYLVGKVAFLLFLVAGYLQYTGVQHAAVRRFTRVRYLVPVSLAYAGLAYVFSRGVAPTVIWQGIPNIMLFFFTAMLIAHIPERRRTLGSNLSSATFAVMAVLWIVYVFGFAPQVRSAVPEVSGVLLFIARNNAYFDIATHIVLAFGMVLILLEDAKRIVDAAHLKLDRAHRRLRDQSLRDSLTGCLNRRAFTEGAGLELIEIGGTVVVADLDNLKDINDEYGHLAGDALLQHFASILRAELRGSDSLFRWGGDEFLLILPEGDAESVMPRLDAHFKAAPQCELPEGQKIALKVSIGAADFKDGGDFQEAIHVADQAMYKQKRVRKNRRNIRPV
jgi:diguanylate cyclase (GGDEF)-like protein